VWLSAVGSKAPKPTRTSNAYLCEILLPSCPSLEHRWDDRYLYSLATLLAAMLPLKRAFVDISSTDESDNSTYVAPKLHHADSIATLVQSQITPISPSICLGMVSSGLGSAVAQWPEFPHYPSAAFC
jgi:hypothetical protein